MGNAPHMKAWPRWAQVLCARLLGHQDRNHSDGKVWYAYCLRCGYLFGHPWSDGRTARQIVGANLMQALRDQQAADNVRRANRCKHGVWAGDHCWKCKP